MRERGRAPWLIPIPTKTDCCAAPWAGRAECLSVEALAAMDAKARAHVEHCAYCRNELAMLVEFQDATPLPGEAADLAWIQSELERRSAATPAAVPAKSLWDRVSDWIARAFPSRGWQMVPMAAGLLLVAAGGDVPGSWKRSVAGAGVRRAGVAFPRDSRAWLR